MLELPAPHQPALKLNKGFADYSTRAPTNQYQAFFAFHEECGTWEEVDVLHVEEVVWDANPAEWIAFNDRFEAGPMQQRPKEWPKHWQWPFDILRNRESIDGPCLNCARGARESCVCLPWQWRRKVDWEPLRLLFRSKEAGIGVRTRTAWKKDEVLGDYIGVLRPYNSDEENHYSLIVPLRKSASTPVAMIDSTKAGNWTRFLNHAANGPNLEIAIRRVGNQRLFVFKAKRDIDWGEELRFNYGSDWDFAGNDRQMARVQHDVMTTESSTFDSDDARTQASNVVSKNAARPTPAGERPETQSTHTALVGRALSRPIEDTIILHGPPSSSRKRTRENQLLQDSEIRHKSFEYRSSQRPSRRPSTKTVKFAAVTTNELH